MVLVSAQKHRDALLEPYRAEDGDLSLESNELCKLRLHLNTQGPTHSGCTTERGARVLSVRSPLVDAYRTTEVASLCGPASERDGEHSGITTCAERECP